MNIDVTDLSIVMPAFNESATIGATIARLREVCPEAEIIVVDDGSRDNTGEIARAAGARVVRNRVNKGYGGSIKRGVREASHGTIVLMDADGQHDPTCIEPLMECFASCDMAVGCREKQDLVKSRVPGKWILSKTAQYLIGQPIPDLNSGFRVFLREDLLRYLSILPNGFSLTSTLTMAMMKDGREVGYIPIRVAARDGGKSTVKYVQDGLRTILLLLRVIMLFNPLKVFAPVGLVLFALGAAYGSYTMVTDSNLGDSTILLVLAGVGSFLFGLLADQVAVLRRAG